MWRTLEREEDKTMKLEILCQVTALAAKKRYPFKPGTREEDYRQKQVEYTQTTISVLPNERGVVGDISLDGEMRYGQLVKLTLDTETTPETVAGSLVAEHAE